MQFLMGINYFGVINFCGDIYLAYVHIVDSYERLDIPTTNLEYVETLDLKNTMVNPY